MTLILNLWNTAALQLLKLICQRLAWAQWPWKSILIRYDASHYIFAGTGQTFKSGLTDCDGNYIPLIGCTGVPYTLLTHAQPLAHALCVSLLPLWPRVVREPWPPHEDSHRVSQLKFDLLTSQKLSNAFCIGFKAWGQLNRLAGEIGLIREANGYDGVTLGISHSLCTAADDGGVMLWGYLLLRGLIEKIAHINCYRQSLQYDQPDCMNTNTSQIKYHYDRKILGQISMLHNWLDWFLRNLLGALFCKQPWMR